MKRLHICALAAMIAFVLLGLSGCSVRNATMPYRPIEDINNLDGRRVGVVLAWSPDYLLSDREDMELMRYDMLADAVLALCYQRVDAIAIERAFSIDVTNNLEGVRVVEEPIATDQLVTFVSNDRADVLEQFNVFIAEFKHSAEYAELMERVRGMETEFETRYVENTGTGPVLRVGMETAAYPFIDYDIEDDAHYGIDAEIITHFANAYNYQIEFVDGTYDSMIQSLAAGKLDICICGLSELYRDEVELSGRALVSDPYMDMEIVFIEIADRSQLNMVADIDY